jgi:hypothetical protein
MRVRRLGLIQPVALELMLSDVERFNLPDIIRSPRIGCSRSMPQSSSAQPRRLSLCRVPGGRFVQQSRRLIELKNAQRAAG